jgi:hypothetical protein
MARKLKVFRTAIGFHDAYVAAPSQKAALEAWGASSNLFAIGSAEVVAGKELTKEPLASPGKVIRRVRGSLEEHLAAGPERKKAKPRQTNPSKPPRRAKTTKPRPSRDKLDQAEAALEKAQADAVSEMGALDRRAADLRREREAAEVRRADAIAQLERELDRVRRRYGRALERWRDE